MEPDPMIVDSSAKLQELGASAADDSRWADEWADVFTMMHQNNMEARAGEYAEAIVALKKNAESLLRQQKTVLESCEQLLHTAYREGLQAHLKVMMEAAATGASPELIAAAKSTVDDLCPPELPTQQQTPPPWKAKQPATAQLGIGIPQPGVIPPPQKATGLLSLPGKARSPPPAPDNSKVGMPGGFIPMPMGQPPIGQFAAAVTAPHQAASQLIVEGLPAGIDEAMFKTLFSRHGNVESVKVIGEKRCGFVRYSDKANAQAAITALNGFESDGVKLSVRFQS